MKRREFLKALALTAVVPKATAKVFLREKTEPPTPIGLPSEMWGVRGSGTILAGDLVGMCEDGQIRTVTDIEHQTILGVANYEGDSLYIDCVSPFSEDPDRLRRVLGNPKPIRVDNIRR